MKRIPWNEGWLYCGSTVVTLPHDAMQTDGRCGDAPSADGGACYRGGRYLYEKPLLLTAEEASGTVMLHFDGVYRKAKVFINSIQAVSVEYGYLPFFANLTGLVRAGENRVTVEADNSEQPNSRWYSGGGIYRQVHLLTGGKTHILPEGIRVKTLGICPAVVEITVRHTGGQISAAVLDGASVIAAGQGDRLRLEIPDAKLWSDESPKLYTCRVSLSENGIPVDEAETTFGIRTLRFESTGFYVNGKRTMLRGGCLHHDNGILGACSYPEAEERKLRILKSAGFNAIRSAHNPASTALLEACDRLGIYVMDEMWDMWYQRKTKYDYGRDFPNRWQQDIAAVVSRDFNHPGVILYSIGNENTEPAEDRGIELCRELTAAFHREDPSRPVTVGMNMALIMMAKMGMGLYANVDDTPVKMPAHINSTAFNELASRSSRMLQAACMPEVNALCTPIMEAVDIVGYNYAALRYPLDAADHPGQVSVGSETYCHQLAATWKMMKRCPWIIGDFMWTALDYIGEVGIGAWAHTDDALEFKKPYPWKLADTGAFDLLGDPTGEALWAEAVWKGETRIAVRPVNHPWQQLARGAWRGTNAIPSWSWAGCEGMPAFVEVYTPGSRVALYLNNEAVSTAIPEDMRAIFEIPYTPGILEAVAYDDDGSECGRDRLCTAVSPCWRILPEQEILHSGQIGFFRIALQDDAGNTESNRDAVLSLEAVGGTLLGFGSAAPRTEAEFRDGTYPSHFGRLLAAVRAESDDVRLTLIKKEDIR